jgi:hypothetical protein
MPDCIPADRKTHGTATSIEKRFYGAGAALGFPNGRELLRRRQTAKKLKKRAHLTSSYSIISILGVLLT